jgi:hypothetical protein
MDLVADPRPTRGPGDDRRRRRRRDRRRRPSAQGRPRPEERATGQHVDDGEDRPPARRHVAGPPVDDVQRGSERVGLGGCTDDGSGEGVRPGRDQVDASVAVPAPEARTLAVQNAQSPSYRRRAADRGRVRRRDRARAGTLAGRITGGVGRSLSAWAEGWYSRPPSQAWPRRRRRRGRLPRDVPAYPIRARPAPSVTTSPSASRPASASRTATPSWSPRTLDRDPPVAAVRDLGEQSTPEPAPSPGRASPGIGAALRPRCRGTRTHSASGHCRRWGAPPAHGRREVHRRVGPVARPFMSTSASAAACAAAGARRRP